LATTLLGPGLIFDLNRVVESFHSKNIRILTKKIEKFYSYR